jgi:plastocyanin
MDNKKKIILIFGLGLIIILVAVMIWQLKTDTNQLAPTETVNNPFVPGEGASTTPRDWAETDVRKEVPVGVVVPEPTSTVPAILKDKVAIPETTAPANPGGTDAMTRAYSVRAEADKFIPEQIIVNLGDTVQVNFTAIDKDYDVVLSGYNMKQNIKKGDTRLFEFQALQDGDFIYYCQTCGGLETGPKGHIIVVK